MGAPTSSYATAGIALRVSGALKPHHHDKIETSSVGVITVTSPIYSSQSSHSYLNYISYLSGQTEHEPYNGHLKYILIEYINLNPCFKSYVAWEL
jgi:hypothetical protein